MEKATLKKEDMENGDYEPLLEAADRLAEQVSEGETKTFTIEVTITNVPETENENEEN